jgi:hypothetical protein
LTLLVPLIPDSRFPIPDSRFPTPDSRFPLPASRFPIPDSRFPIPDSPYDRVAKAPMADNDKKPIAHLVPAILTGAATLIASLTAVYVNLRGDKAANQPQTTAVVAAKSDVAADAAKPLPPLPSDRLQLQLDRIAVQHDGSIGTTDWRFALEADGQPLLVFRQDGLDDTGGRNIVNPNDVQTLLRLPAGQRARLTIKGWRGSRLRLIEGEPDVTGEGVIDDGVLAPIPVKANKDSAGTFVFYFSAVRRNAE